MQAIALLALVFGVMMQMLLDGQTFTHAIFGIVCGAVAVLSGLISARKYNADSGRLWMRRVMAGLGLVLAIFCIVGLPSAYKFQTKFNERSRKAHEIENTKPKPNTSMQPVTLAMFFHQMKNMQHPTPNNQYRMLVHRTLIGRSMLNVEC